MIRTIDGIVKSYQSLCYSLCLEHEESIIEPNLNLTYQFIRTQFSYQKKFHVPKFAQVIVLDLFLHQLTRKSLL